MTPSRNPYSLYVGVAATVWVAILTAVTALLKGTPYIIEILPILLGGAAIFIFLVPMILRPPTPPRSR